MAMNILYAYKWLEWKVKETEKIRPYVLAVNIIRAIGYIGLSTGIVAAFWQLSMWAGVLFLSFSIISLLCYLLYSGKIDELNNLNASPTQRQEDVPKVSG